MILKSLATAASICAVWTLFAQDQTATQQQTPQSRKTIEVTIEQKQGSEWKPVSSQKVFRANDVVRFRLQSQIPGYLYVLNHESDGVKTWLYPRTETAASNYVDIDRPYTIPDSKGSFTVGGKPGFDVTYWMISPTSLAVDTGINGRRGEKPSTLLPRCDGQLRARGDCEDKQAGPHAITDPAQVPPAFSAQGGLISRDLTFSSATSSVQISTPEALSGSIIYALWIAHQ
ncbi:MAG TPA: DUF4384 domain-containing protein [Bryobacteraceae bacterium]|nr:DUF4384 domain-containing protein [Bryobacteraceae bacterium]